jgi:tRNA A37 N6-isopentenylltransferase MiaA
MSQIYYIFGPSSVGKTTLINNILKNKNDIIVISADDIFNELRRKTINKSNKELKKDNLIENEMIKRIKKIYKKNIEQPIIIDHTNLKFIGQLNDNGIKFKLILILAPLKQIYKNINSREIKRFSESIVFELADILIYKPKESPKKQFEYILKYNDLIKYNFIKNEKQMSKLKRKLNIKVEFEMNSKIILTTRIDYDYIFINNNIEITTNNILELFH